MPGKMHVKKGDLVAVLSGEDKGKTGKILEVDPTKLRVVVDRVNIIKKHTKPTRTNPQGGVMEQPGPMPVSKVQPVCPSCDKPTRVNHKRSADGSVTRECKRCGKAMD